jgi:hypothetical protein
MAYIIILLYYYILLYIILLLYYYYYIMLERVKAIIYRGMAKGCSQTAFALAGRAVVLG